MSAIEVENAMSIEFSDESEAPLCTHELGKSTSVDWMKVYDEFLTISRKRSVCATCAITAGMYLAMQACVGKGLTEEQVMANVRSIFRDVAEQIKEGTAKQRA
jgi:hypothetical protein